MYLNSFTTLDVKAKAGRLTLTWDVFKSSHNLYTCYYNYWLTLTWDVFKSMC